MLNKDLIKLLSSYPEDAIVQFCASGNGYFSELDSEFDTYEKDGLFHIIISEKEEVK